MAVFDWESEDEWTKLILGGILLPLIRLNLSSQDCLVGEGAGGVKEGRCVLLKSTGLFEVIFVRLSVDSGTSTLILPEGNHISFWTVS